MSVDVTITRKSGSDPDNGNKGGGSGGIDGLVLEACAVSSLSSISQQPAMLANLAYSNTVANTNLSMQNAVANQQAVNELGVAILGKTISRLTTLGPLESKSASEILTGNAVAEPLAGLQASVQAFNSNPRRRRQRVPNPLPSGQYFAEAPVHLKMKPGADKLNVREGTV